MTEKDGSAWYGWALLAGLPATIGVALVANPLAVPLAVATFAAVKRGQHLDREAADDRAQEAITESRRKREVARMQGGDEAFSKLFAEYDSGAMEHHEFIRAFNQLQADYLDP